MALEIIGTLRQSLSISTKDLEHLQKYAKFVESSVRIHKSVCTVSVQDKFYTPKICKKFDIKQNKTYNPPTFVQNNKNISLLIGYIDGDGSINLQYKRNYPILRIKCHSSWIDWLTNFANILNVTSPYINNKNYCVWNICNQKVLLALKQHAIKRDLPIMYRKWKLVA